MSGLTPIPLTRFRDLLGARGHSLEALADEIGCGRSHLSQVLWGHRRGGDTWAEIRAVVTDDEWETLLQMEHCATWNTAQCAAGEDALVWKMRERCAWCQRPRGFKECTRAMAGRVTDGICPDCYATFMAEVARMDNFPADRESVGSGCKTRGGATQSPAAGNCRSFLVQTDDGLRIHRADTAPLGADRKLPDAFVQGDAATAPITCAIGKHPFLSRFKYDPESRDTSGV